LKLFVDCTVVGVLFTLTMSAEVAVSENVKNAIFTSAAKLTKSCDFAACVLTFHAKGFSNQNACIPNGWKSLRNTLSK